MESPPPSMPKLTHYPILARSCISSAPARQPKGEAPPRRCARACDRGSRRLLKEPTSSSPPPTVSHKSTVSRYMGRTFGSESLRAEGHVGSRRFVRHWELFKKELERQREEANNIPSELERLL